MDQIALATITSALTVLATDCAKGAASEAGKSLWSRVTALFEWKDAPAPADLAQTIATRLIADGDLAMQIVQLLKASSGSDGTTQVVASLVSNLSADKVGVANRIEGGVTM